MKNKTNVEDFYKVEITQQRLADLERYANMLGRISNVVSPFAKDEENTLCAVARLMTEHYDLLAHEAWESYGKFAGEDK